MTLRIARRMGVAGAVAGVLALGAYAYTVALPYRLSPAQDRLVGVAVLVQLAGLALAVGLGIPALRGDTRARGLGCTALGLGALTLLLVLFTSHVHSVSHPLP